MCISKARAPIKSDRALYGLLAATARRNTSNMKISRASLLCWSRERFQIISNKHTVPRRSARGVAESAQMRTRPCVLAIKRIGELNSSDIYPRASAAIVGSDCVNKWRWRWCLEARALAVWLIQHANDEKDRKYVHIWFYFCGRDHASSRHKQIGRCLECPRVFSSTVPTPVAPNPLPWCFADGTLGNIPGGGCNEGNFLPV